MLRYRKYAPFFLRMGDDVYIEEGCRFYHPERIVLDDGARINISTFIYGSGGIWIGRHVRIGPRCFIHSANHETSADANTAFFERGYLENSVKIEDLSLVSGNVSILPGAKLGAGCFISCGAVVTRGKYEEGAKLFGIPANNKNTSITNEQYELVSNIIILVPQDGHWHDLACHIIGALGLPQVRIIRSNQYLPDDIQSILIMGPPGWDPGLPNKSHTWRFQQTDIPLNKNIFPERIPKKYVFLHDRQDPDSISAQLNQAGFWIFTRLKKNAKPLKLSELIEWNLAVELLESTRHFNSRFLDDITLHINKRKPVLLKLLEKLLGKGFFGQRMFLVPMEMESLSYLFKWKKQFRIKDYIGNPVRLIIDIRKGIVDSSIYEDYLRRALSRPTGMRMICAGIAACLLQDESSEKIGEMLSAGDWRADGIHLPRSTKAGKRFCYSPLVLSWIILKSMKNKKHENIPDKFGIEEQATQHMFWGMFDNGELFDEEHKIISYSLLENWRLLHECSLPDGAQFLIDRDNYVADTYRLERYWLRIFKLICRTAGHPLIKLSPWPARCRSAVSIRYDVDRPVSAKRIAELVRLQYQIMNAPCASWYYFPNDNYRTKQSAQLNRHWQDVGLHIESIDEEVSGMGITHHSAPTSSYWHGDETTLNLDRYCAKYGELLSARITMPRPAWIKKDGYDSLGELWYTPIHYPLEASTNETDLSYFDKLLDIFHEACRNSGHIIIGSHPDLNQDILKQLFDREDLNEAWLTTVDNAVSRCQLVMTYGNISATVNNGKITLSSKHTVADLCITIWEPDSEKEHEVQTQLIAGRPRDIVNPASA